MNKGQERTLQMSEGVNGMVEYFSLSLGVGGKSCLGLGGILYRPL